MSIERFVQKLLLSCTMKVVAELDGEGVVQENKQGGV